MKTRLLLLTVCVVLSSCSSPAGRVELTPPQTPKGFHSAENGPGITGILRVTQPQECALANGCGPQYSLWDTHLANRLALDGYILAHHDQLVITVHGASQTLPVALQQQTGYAQIDTLIKVREYDVRSKLPYQRLLNQGTATYLQENYGCSATLWDKTYTWAIERGAPVLSITLSPTLGQQVDAYLELAFDGISGELRRDKLSGAATPCG